MSDFVDSVLKIIRGAQKAEDDKNYFQALGYHNTALMHIARAAMNNELTDTSLKGEVEILIDNCLISFNKLVEQQNKVDKGIKGISKQNYIFMKRVEWTIISEIPKINFEDLCGMENLKRQLLNAVILPVRQPQLFTGGRDPHRSFLFFGPPGTGKTYLARATAGQAGCSNFFSIKASDILSKYIGESEKTIRALFECARKRTPSIIFIDEIDALAGQRSSDDMNKSRGMKNELFMQIAGVENDNNGIFILAATNMPFDLDEAILRRFDRLFHVTLPDERDRYSLFKKLMISNKEAPFSEENFETLSRKSKGFSNSDIAIVCKRANILPVDRLFDISHFQVSKEPGTQNKLYTPCKPNDDGAVNIEVTKIRSGVVVYKPITTFEDALKCVREHPIVTSPNEAKMKKFAEERERLNLSSNFEPVPEDFWLGIVDTFSRNCL